MARTILPSARPCSTFSCASIASWRRAKARISSARIASGTRRGASIRYALGTASRTGSGLRHSGAGTADQRTSGIRCRLPRDQLVNHFSSRAKKADALFKRSLSDLSCRFSASSWRMRCCSGVSGLTHPRSARAFLVVLLDPAANSTLDQVHVATHLGDAHALLSNRANYLQLECSIKGSPGSFFCHACLVLVGKSPYRGVHSDWTTSEPPDQFRIDRPINSRMISEVPP